MIKLDRIKKSYGDREILTEVTVEIRRRELLSLVGPNGSGKTTTLNVIAGLIRPDAGAIWINGVLMDGKAENRVIHVNPSERRIGYMFQESALFPHMTVRENISYGMKARHVSKSEIINRTRSLLEFVGLHDYSESYPHQLSGGQKQKTALARAISIEPDILLLDEPLSALDIGSRETIRVELKKMLKALEVTTIYVTHEITEACEMSDRIAVMGLGRIEQIGTHEEVFSRPTPYVAQIFKGFLGNGNASQSSHDS